MKDAWKLGQNRTVALGTLTREVLNHLLAAVPNPLLNYRDRHIVFHAETIPLVTECVHTSHEYFQFAEQGMQHSTQDVVQPHRASSSTLENVAEGPIPDPVFYQLCKFIIN